MASRGVGGLVVPGVVVGVLLATPSAEAHPLGLPAFARISATDLQRATGRVERVPAAFDAATRRWVAPVTLAAGDAAFVGAGDVRDTFGERNGAASPVTRG